MLDADPGHVTPDTPILIEGCDTVLKLWRRRCEEKGAAPAHREKTRGVWQAHSWEDWWEHARWCGLALQRLGLRAGDAVQILSEDRREWLYADMGIAGAGGVPSGIYTTDSAKQLSYLVEDCAAKFLFVENDEQLDKWLEVRGLTPSLIKVVVFDRAGLRGFRDDQVMFWDELMELGREEAIAHPTRFEESLEAVGPEDVRTLIYTSGTTGPPKGAMITHRNMMFQLEYGGRVVEYRPTDEQLCFLPLCHVLERLVSVDNPIHIGSTVNFAESTETVFENLMEVSPHMFTAVPRMWEKIR